jgi:hypothetical protein
MYISAIERIAFFKFNGGFEITLPFIDKPPQKI